MKTIGYITFYIAAITYASLVSGWAVSKLWLWFIADTFSVQALSIPESIGLALIVEYLAKSKPGKDGRGLAEQLLEAMVFCTLKAGAAVGIGAIVKMWL